MAGFVSFDLGLSTWHPAKSEFLVKPFMSWLREQVRWRTRSVPSSLQVSSHGSSGCFSEDGDGTVIPSALGSLWRIPGVS